MTTKIKKVGDHQHPNNINTQRVKEQALALETSDLQVQTMQATFRVQQQFYSNEKSKPISLFNPLTDKQKGRWNGKETVFGLTYLAKTPKGAFAESLAH